jgi:hypothetical protein
MNCFQYGWKWTFIDETIDDDEQSSFMKWQIKYMASYVGFINIYVIGGLCHSTHVK